MVLDKIGQGMTIEGKVYTVGDAIYATDRSDYEGLYGVIIEIIDGEEKETGNEGVDIACEFHAPVNHNMIREIEERFSVLYGVPKTIDELALDYVIMGTDMIRPVKSCRIYQLDLDNSEARQRMVAGYLDKPIPSAELYQLAYDGRPGTEDLEELFAIFNLEHPEDYLGRSLSVTDVIELYDENGSTFYHCDTFGFREVPFDSKKAKGR